MHTIVATKNQQKVFVGLILIAPFSVVLSGLLVVFSLINQDIVAKKEAICEPSSVPEFGKIPSKSLQAEVELKLDKVKQTAAKSESELSIAKERKQTIIDAYYFAPERALSVVAASNINKESKDKLSDCFEQIAEFEGDLEVEHVDFFDQQASDTRYILNTGDGKKISLHFARDLAVDLESRTRIKIRGYLLDSELLLDGTKSIREPDEGLGGIEVISQPGNPPVLGEQKIVVLLANFQDTVQPTTTRDQMNAFISTRLKPYYAENSYSKISLTAQTFGWYKLPIARTCNTYTAMTSVVSVADAEVDFRNYDRVILIAPFGPNCGWSGSATLGKIALNTADGQVLVSRSYIASGHSTSLYIVGHELGHNFGQQHAKYYNCGATTIIEPCTFEDYGDSYDILGGSNNFHFNTPHKESVGWFNPGNLLEVTTSGTYTLENIEVASGNLKALKIRRSNNNNPYLYLEYRRPVGFDSLAPVGSNIYQGALMHTAYTPSSPYLIDPTPPSTKSTIVILPGVTWTDPATATKIRVVSASTTSLVVNVTLGKTEFVNPTVSIVSPSNGSTVSGDTKVIANASDESGILKVDFALNGSPTPFASDSDAPYEVLLDTKLLKNGSNYIRAKAYDRSGLAYLVEGNFANSNAVGINVANPLGDQDGDGVDDALDNCVNIANADQANLNAEVIDLPSEFGFDDITNPTGDNVGDACDDDRDHDLLANSLEIGSGTDQNDPDSDDDSYLDGAEVKCGSDPKLKVSVPRRPSDISLKDTDSDLVPDSCESIFGSNPNVKDTDGDSLPDGTEILRLGTNALLYDSDRDGCFDGLEVASINGDKSVNSLDQSLLTSPVVFGTRIGDAGYVRNFDINGDGAINVGDSSVLAFYLGKSCGG